MSPPTHGRRRGGRASPAPPATIGEAWIAGREHLEALGVPEAAITAEVLLRHALNLTRTQLYVAWGRSVGPDAWARYEALLDERATGRPLAYIVGRREFMGLGFLVDERVLIPRPETEILVETVLEALRDTPGPLVADVGTGSGAIAISVAVARPDARVLATDLAPEALEVARANAARHGVAERVRFLEGDLLEPLVAAGARPDLIACNPPYVAPEDAAGLPREIRDFEPRIAVVAPGFGESVHARLIAGAPAVLPPGGWLVMEAAAGQGPRVIELLHRSGAFDAPLVRRDGLGWDRVVAARVPTAPGRRRE
ncbi:MAG: peptide chain release factor N(5)-glutamine methyltransferase [Armatimonadota bacterium]|nr:peptide chain release factor N(5)-glutamine methyltransferase [Armatimonadota bacterium]MDR7511709.1 peptide chain release factor N(5)-glutamine methyltransferase [Armatimonadota bacterium]